MLTKEKIENVLNCTIESKIIESLYYDHVCNFSFFSIVVLWRSSIVKVTLIPVGSGIPRRALNHEFPIVLQFYSDHILDFS